MDMSMRFQTELALEMGGAPSPSGKKPILLVGQTRKLHASVVSLALKGFGARVVSYPNCGLTTMLDGIHRNLLKEGKNVLFHTCEIEPEFVYQAIAFSRSTPGTWNPGKKDMLAKNSTSYLAEVCAERLFVHGIDVVILDRVDLTSKAFGEFTKAVASRCLNRGANLVLIAGQRIVTAEDQLFIPTDTECLSINAVLPTLDLADTLEFVSGFCSNAVDFRKLFAARHDGTAKAVSALMQYHEGEIGKLVRFCRLKNALFALNELTDDIVREILDVLRNPMMLIDSLG